MVHWFGAFASAVSSMDGIRPSGPGTGLVNSMVAHCSDTDDLTWVSTEVMVVTAAEIASDDSPRASWRAALEAAWWSFDWCMPMTITLITIAITNTTTGKMTANSAVTEP